MENLYMGYPTNYWAELQKKAEKLDVVKWLEEIAELRGKVSFYESRLDEIEDFRKV